MPGEYNFNHTYGDSLDRTITWKDSSLDPVDLSGYSAHMQVCDPRGSVVLNLSTAGATIVLGGAAGTIQLVASPTLMSFPPKTYLYDLVLTSSSSFKSTILQGEFVLNSKITQG